MRCRSILRLALATMVALGLSPTRAGGQSAPPDSLLAAACADGGSTAYGLLLVVFRGDLPEARRQAVARDAGGRLVGPAGGQETGDYVMLPPGTRSDLAADQLIRQDGVESVGDVACPPPPPPPAPADTAAPADTTPSPDSAAQAAAQDTAARSDSAPVAGPPAPPPESRVIR